MVKLNHLIKVIIFLTPFLLLNAHLKQKNITVESSRSGILRLHEFNSKTFQNKRIIRVLLPPDYYEKENKNTRYKVLYMNDGQDLFDSKTSLYFSSEWQIDESIHKLLLQGMMEEPIIVVGIDIPSKKMRPNEYLPWEDEYLQPHFPNTNGEKYPDFLVSEIMPFIESLYRIKKGPDNTALGGASYGSLISLYTAVKKPDIFGFLLLESPSFYVNNKAILKESKLFLKWPQKIYIGVGTNELGVKDCKQIEGNLEPVHDVLEFISILKESGMKKEQILLIIDECARHSPAAWSKRFPKALMFWLIKN